MSILGHAVWCAEMCVCFEVSMVAEMSCFVLQKLPSGMVPSDFDSMEIQQQLKTSASGKVYSCAYLPVVNVSFAHLVAQPVYHCC